jgi:hypothetical protein
MGGVPVALGGFGVGADADGSGEGGEVRAVESSALQRARRPLESGCASGF